MGRRPFTITVAVLIGLLSVPLSIVVNVYSNGLPSALQSHRGLAGILVVVLGLATVALTVIQLIPGLTSTAPGAVGGIRRRLREQAHSKLVSKVRRIHIRDSLERELHELPWIDLALVERPQATDHRWTPALTPRGLHDRPLPAGTAGAPLFELLGDAFLVLGNAGSGKTTLLRELARGLLEKAEADSAQPIPVLLSLSPWDPGRQSFETWLVSELKERYGVSRRLGEAWVEEDHLVLLLDNLDEVAHRLRRPCVEALNAFRSEYGQMTLVGRIVPDE